MKINKPEKFIFDKTIRDVEDIAYKSENAEEFVKICMIIMKKILML